MSQKLHTISLLQSLGIFVGVLVLHFILDVWTLVEIKDSDECEAPRVPATMAVIFNSFLAFIAVILLIALWRKERKDQIEQPVSTIVPDENTL